MSKYTELEELRTWQTVDFIKCLKYLNKCKGEKLLILYVQEANIESWNSHETVINFSFPQIFI